jgi:hypothetical protein
MNADRGSTVQAAFSPLEKGLESPVLNQLILFLIGNNCASCGAILLLTKEEDSTLFVWKYKNYNT